MRCEDCGTDFHGVKCACGWKAPALTPVAQTELWTYRECEAQGCTAMIRERPGAVGSRFCKWCAAQGITVQKAAVLESPTGYLTREQFGASLYQAIAWFAGREEIRQQYRQLVTNLDVPAGERKRRLGDLKTREADLTSHITSILPTLHPHDVRRLLARYEAGEAA